MTVVPLGFSTSFYKQAGLEKALLLLYAKISGYHLIRPRGVITRFRIYIKYFPHDIGQYCRNIR
jgi:hypothetical protein